MRRAALLWGVFVLPGNGALFHAEAERVFPMNHTIHLKKQLRCIYLSNFFSGLRITDAVWVALLAVGDRPCREHLPYRQPVVRGAQRNGRRPAGA